MRGCFFRVVKRQHKNTDTNPCQSVLRASQNQAAALSIQESPAATLLLSSGNAGSCCKGWYPCFWCCHTFYESAEFVLTSLGPGTSGKDIRSLYTGIYGFLSAKAAFRPEYSRYTWQMWKIESFHGELTDFLLHTFILHKHPFFTTSLKNFVLK